MDYDYVLRVAYADSMDTIKLTEFLCADVVFNNIPGDFCEAGCANGAHGIIMKHASRGQKIHLFDSFEGIPVHGPEDLEWTEAHGPSIADPRKSGGITVCKIENVKQTMLRVLPDLNGVIFKKGWFVDSFKELTTEKFSVLRLDCDLYESYMECFRELWPRLSIGGWLIIDDYNLSGCKQAIEDSRIPLYGMGRVGQNVIYIKKIQEWV